MHSTRAALLLAFVLLVPSLAAAHVTKTVSGGAITVKAGWLEEPPSSGARNHIFFAIWRTNSGEAITSLGENLKASISYLGQTKDLDMEESDENPGNYTAPILPTKPGVYVLHLDAIIDGKRVKEDFNIEDMKDGSDEAFPGEGGDLATRLAALEERVTAHEAKAKTESETPTKTSAQSPSKGVPTLGLVAALAALGTVALILRQRRG